MRWKHNLVGDTRQRVLEIREYANIIGNEIVAKWVPHVWEAFSDYRLGGMFFSRHEQRMLTAIMSSRCIADIEAESDGMTKRERAAFTTKLEKLGVNIPLWRSTC